MEVSVGGRCETKLVQVEGARETNGSGAPVRYQQLSASIKLPFRFPSGH
jgi:hypothetical protein